jgi:RNA polymerase sigma-70 factor (ECF subfamily)
VNRALDGDRESLGWLVTRFTPLLKAQASWRLGPTFDGRCPADDIVAEAWLVALRKRGDIVRDGRRSTPRLLAFLGTTVLNITNRRIEEFLRRGDLQGPLPWASYEGETPGGIADTVTGAVTNAARNETAAMLEATLQSLAPADREVILLRVVEGLSNQEAARSLGEAPNTVSQRYSRALARLREALPESFLADLEES